MLMRLHNLCCPFVKYFEIHHGAQLHQLSRGPKQILVVHYQCYKNKSTRKYFIKELVEPQWANTTNLLQRTFITSTYTSYIGLLICLNISWSMYIGQSNCLWHSRFETCCMVASKFCLFTYSSIHRSQSLIQNLTPSLICSLTNKQSSYLSRHNCVNGEKSFTLMITGAFSRNVGKLFSKLKLITDNLLLIYSEAN